ncbi:hypothetical protein [Pseudorhodoplanes sinuspersici]|uniref:Uncharacterized protein n=1 Tax=Pseudorhodoplanes sinuspersici TaxID=1235591 RepID=A0A1W6ZWY9_9HYPH|nr:hypothetical protein [Pseudorhodoplanes sinuspersici]ARQ01833.1 hypothetical protein CAK95_24090 [Pseudorhodoplanes sinuspersici]RKE73590.1 hypothetical protein DFP91_1481 [Pseudorhodoplanes sinuspersici]
MTAGTALVVALITLAFLAFALGLAFVDFWSRNHRRPLQTPASEQAARAAMKTAAKGKSADLKAA